MPVYNEVEVLPQWLRTLDAALPDSENYFVLSDDGSNDQLIEKLKSETNLPAFIILGDGVNRGPGAAFAKGFEYILKQGSTGDVVITVEADGTADTASLQPMINALNTNDVAMASVYLSGGGFTQTGWMRLLLSNVANAFTRTILNLPYRTLTSFYRCYRFEALQKLSTKYPKLLEEKGFICQVELLYKCRESRLNITEIPTKVFSDRRKGPSKMKVMRTIFEHLRFVFNTRFNR
jgi:dolichol-phosphate mannosyltransferase